MRVFWGEKAAQDISKTKAILEGQTNGLTVEMLLFGLAVHKNIECFIF